MAACTTRRPPLTAMTMTVQVLGPPTRSRSRRARGHSLGWPPPQGLMGPGLSRPLLTACPPPWRWPGERHQQLRGVARPPPARWRDLERGLNQQRRAAPTLAAVILPNGGLGPPTAPPPPSPRALAAMGRLRRWPKLAGRRGRLVEVAAWAASAAEWSWRPLSMSGARRSQSSGRCPMARTRQQVQVLVQRAGACALKPSTKPAMVVPPKRRRHSH
jgi:hypothetical protein